MEYECHRKHCPPFTVFDGKPICCKECGKSKAKYITDSNKHLWTEDMGFCSLQGCRLSREQMPKECREYDCRDYKWVYMSVYVKDCWHFLVKGELSQRKEK